MLKNRTSLLTTIFVAVIFGGVMPQIVSAEVLSVDTDFGVNGAVVADGIAGGDYDRGHSGLVDSSGRYLVVGYSDDGDSTLLSVIRYTASGLLDTTFGGGDGIALFDGIAGGTERDFANSIKQDSNGRYLVGGGSHKSGDGIGTPLNIDAVVLRLTTNGDLDSTFGVNGVVALDDLTNSSAEGVDEATDLIIDSSGKILVTGYSYAGPLNNDMFVARLNSDGTLDTSFGGGDGVFTQDGAAGGSSVFDIGRAIDIDHEGRIVVTGNGQNVSGDEDMLIWRLTSAGVLDATFATDGTVHDGGAAGGNDQNDRGYGIKAISDGRVFVAGVSTDIAGYFIPTFWMYDEDGTLDTTFDSDGYFIHNNFDGDYFAQDVTQVIDGKLLIVGYGYDTDGNPESIIMWVINLDGTLDEDPVAGGFLQVTQPTGVPLTEFELTGISLNSNSGKIVVAGSITEVDPDPDDEEEPTSQVVAIVYDFVYEIESLDSSLATLVDGVSTRFGYGSHEVTLTKASGTLAKVNATFGPDLNWSAISADAAGGKAFVHSLAGAPGAGSTYTLYIPKVAGADGVYVCPGADSLEEIVEGCAGGYELRIGDAGLAVETIDSVEYFVVTGVSGTGALNLMAEAGSTTGGTTTGGPTSGGTLAPTGVNAQFVRWGALVMVIGGALGALYLNNPSPLGKRR